MCTKCLSIVLLHIGVLNIYKLITHEFCSSLRSTAVVLIANGSEHEIINIKGEEWKRRENLVHMVQYVVFHQVRVQCYGNCTVLIDEISWSLPLSLVRWGIFRNCQELEFPSSPSVWDNTSNFDHFVAILSGVELGRLSSVLTNARWLNVLELSLLDVKNVVITNGVQPFDTDSNIFDTFQWFERAKAFCTKLLKPLC